MKKAIYFNSKLATCKTVTGVTSLEQARSVVDKLCRMFGWNVNDITEIKIV